MRLLASQLLVQLLATLLVLTTPVGTGEGVHQDQLLHPIFAHSHVVDGRIVSDTQLAAARAAAAEDLSPAPPSHGPALGAGSGVDSAGAGLALGPMLPDTVIPFFAGDGRRVLFVERSAPAEFRDAPQDPPPNVFA